MEHTQSVNQGLLNLTGGISLIGMALCYCVVFIIYGALLPPAEGAEISSRITHLSDHAMLINLSYMVGYIMFACLLCLSVQVVQRNFGHISPFIISTASLFGLFWVLVLLAAGMIGITSINMMSVMNIEDSIAATASYQTAIILQEGLGGGIELLGGVWVLLIGIVSWLNKLFSKPFTVFSLIKGVIGVATLLFTQDILRDSFGLTGIIWFVWFGIIMLKQTR